MKKAISVLILTILLSSIQLSGQDNQPTITYNESQLREIVKKLEKGRQAEDELQHTINENTILIQKTQEQETYINLLLSANSNLTEQKNTQSLIILKKDSEISLLKRKSNTNKVIAISLGSATVALSIALILVAIK